jgi:hypothetical protein
VGNSIQLSNLSANSKVEVYNLKGSKINSLNSGNSPILKILIQTKGLYLVKVNNQIVKVPVR